MTAQHRRLARRAVHRLRHRRCADREPAGDHRACRSSSTARKWTPSPATWTSGARSPEARVDRWVAGRSGRASPPSRRRVTDSRRNACTTDHVSPDDRSASDSSRQRAAPDPAHPLAHMHAEGSVLIEAGRHAGHLHRQRRGPRAAVPAQLRQGLGDGRVRHAAARHHHAHAARGVGRQGRRADAGDPAADRPVAARGDRARELGERTVWIDCDVIQADGGTRTARSPAASSRWCWRSRRCAPQGRFATLPIARLTSRRPASASSTAQPLLDLAYDEDSRAEVDMNVVKTGDGRFIEVQGTAEAAPFEPRRARRAARAGRQPASASWSSCSAAWSAASAHDVSAAACSSRPPTPASSARSAGILPASPVEL